jgi:hypothetical protein
MARKFLTSIDLNGNELIKGVVQNATSDPETGKAGQIYYNTSDDVLKVYSGGASAWLAVGSSEFIGDAVNDLLVAGNGIYLDYNDIADSLTITNTGALSLTGTSNEVTVSASAGDITIGLPESITVDVTGDLTGNADTASELETARTISLSGPLSGSASFDGSADITISATMSADSVTLGTHTTGDYVASASAGYGIEVSGSGGEGSGLTITNTGVLTLTGTSNQVTVSASAGDITIGLPEDVTIDGDLTVDGNLTVSGSTTYLNTETLTVEDNKIVLNSSITGTPTTDSGIEVERGDLQNAEMYWDESEKKWSVSDGSATYVISLDGHNHSASAILGFNDAVDDEIDNYLVGSDSISVSSGSIDITLSGTASASFLTTVGGLSVDKSSLETALVLDDFTRKFTTTIGDGSEFNIDHDLGTRDVTVQVYELSSYETVEVDVDRDTVNRVIIRTASVVSADSLRVVVIG